MIQLSNTVLKVDIALKGAELKSIYHLQHELEYLWQGDAAFWNRNAPVLFPIVGKVKNNTYSYHQKQYHLPQHGFARDMNFECEEHSDTHAVFVLKSNEETSKVYPFQFSFYITYTLTENSIRVAYKVVNASEQTMYFSVGAHPAFNCPLEKGLTFEDYQLTFEQKETAHRLLLGTNGVSRNTELVLNNTNVLPLDYNLFKEKDAIIFKDLQSKFMVLASKKSNRAIDFNYAGFPYMGIWTKPGPFLCIEPWYGIADFEDADGLLNQKEGIQELEVSGTFQAHYDMKFI
jgi:galactose mutarotase-like enzyme